MNPQQPMQDSGVAPSPEQPIVGGEPVAVVPQMSQPEVVPQVQPPQVDSFSPSPTTTPTQPPLVQADVQGSSVPIAVQPVATPVVQPAGQPVITPSAGLAPSSPGIPTVQPPVPPITGQGTVGNGGPAMSPYPMPTEGTKKQKIIKFGVIGGAIVVLLVAGILGFTMWKNNQIALETYEGDGYTMLVPVGYEESVEDDETVNFTEVSEDAGEQSVVSVGASVVPESATEEDIKQVKELFTEDKIKEALEGDNTDDVPLFKGAANIQLKTTDEDNKYVVSGTADIVEDGITTGKIYLKFTLTDKNLSLVAVRADASDPGLDNKAQTIIDSLKFE